MPIHGVMRLGYVHPRITDLAEARSHDRNEVFSGGYVAYPDRPTVNWTPDQLGKGIFSIQRELNERFTTVLT